MITTITIDGREWHVKPPNMFRVLHTQRQMTKATKDGDDALPFVLELLQRCVVTSATDETLLWSKSDVARFLAALDDPEFDESAEDCSLFHANMSIFTKLQEAIGGASETFSDDVEAALKN